MLSIVKQLLALLGVILVAGSAFGLTVSGAEAEISFHQSPYSYEFEVINESSQNYPFDVQLLSPVLVNRILQPSIIHSNSTNKIILQLIPGDDLLGQVIAGTLVVKYGSQESRKEITMTFEKAAAVENPTSESPATDNSASAPNILAGFFALGFNPSLLEAIVDAILLVVVIVLVVGLVSRVSKRVKK